MIYHKRKDIAVSDLDSLCHSRSHFNLFGNNQ